MALPAVNAIGGRLAASIEDIAVAEDLGERTLRGMTRPVAVRNLTSLKG